MARASIRITRTTRRIKKNKKGNQNKCPVCGKFTSKR